MCYDQPTMWIETLIATTEYNGVFNEFSQGPLLSESGGLMNFKMSSFDEPAFEQMVQMALSKSRFIALLFATYISFIHGSEPLAKPYLSRLKQFIFWPVLIV